MVARDNIAIANGFLYHKDMRLVPIGKIISRQYLIMIIAVLLLSAFGLHMLSIDHHHPWDVAGGDRIQAALHGGEKRWLVCIAILFVYAGLAALFVEYNNAMRRLSRKFFEIPLLFDCIRSALRKGIVHPKLYA